MKIVNYILLIASLSAVLLGSGICFSESAKPLKLTSLATKNFTGDEKRPVTIPAGVEIPHNKVWKNVDQSTALIIVRNFSGVDFDYFQLQIGVYRGKPKSYNVSWHGYGQLLNGEKRIIKARNRTPIAGIKLVLSGWKKKGKTLINVKRSWYSYDEGFREGFAGGTPIISTVEPANRMSIIYHPEKWGWAY